MKNKFLKKTVGTMLVASMLCMMVATGCTGDNTAQNTATEPVTEVATEETTETATEPATDTEPKEVVTIKAGPDTTTPGSDNFDHGITVEGTNRDYKFLITKGLSDSETDYKITDERVKEIFDITMHSKVGKDNGIEIIVEDQYSTSLNETVKVSIPYDEGMYVLASENGVAYDVNADYIDGKYVFETDTLGKFIISTESTGRTEPTKTENVELAEQTITDELTGVQVSGMLPVDAKMSVTLEVIDSKLSSIQWNSFYDAEAGIVHTIQSEFPNLTNPADYCCEKTEVENIAEIITDPSWTVYENMTGGRLQASVVFTKNFEILDFESDLTVTLPFDYRKGLSTGNVSGDAVVEQYNYNTNDFVVMEVLSADATAQGTFQFKTKTPGRFFFGTEDLLSHMKGLFESEIAE